MIKKDPTLKIRINCILHVCGDDPRVTDVLTVAAKYSPRMWR